MQYVIYLQRSRLLIQSKTNKQPFCMLLCQAQTCYPSWGRLAGRGQIETRQRGDDKLEHQFQENDTLYPFLLFHRALTLGLMLFKHTQTFQLLSHPCPSSYLFRRIPLIFAALHVKQSSRLAAPS